MVEPGQEHYGTGEQALSQIRFDLIDSRLAQVLGREPSAQEIADHTAMLVLHEQELINNGYIELSNSTTNVEGFYDEHEQAEFLKKQAREVIDGPPDDAEIPPEVREALQDISTKIRRDSIHIVQPGLPEGTGNGQA